MELGPVRAIGRNRMQATCNACVRSATSSERASAGEHERGVASRADGVSVAHVGVGLDRLEDLRVAGAAVVADEEVQRVGGSQPSSQPLVPVAARQVLPNGAPRPSDPEQSVSDGHVLGSG